MKILKLIIKDYQQFKHLELDFTHPETGKPLDKICFIGKNATGKSTLLRLISDFLEDISEFKPYSFMIFKVLLENEPIYCIFGNKNRFFAKEQIENIDNWLNDIKNIKLFAKNNANVVIPFDEISTKITFQDNNKDLVIYSPSEDDYNDLLSIDDIPSGDYSMAIDQYLDFPFFNKISEGNIDDFWNLLIYLIQKRKENYLIFLQKKENKDKTITEIEVKFENEEPLILKQLADIWDKILSNVNLYFDYENAKLSDNLKVYIKLQNQSSLEDDIIPYNKLSTGIRNFIFKIGHIFSLYFNRKIKRGFLLVDEPENSLFPDFLYDLIDDIYLDIIKNQNTQFFVATHNPIIATQFEPEERIVLDFDEAGYVISRKGIVPVGDDPNDILLREFNMRSIYTKKGLEKWNRFVKLEELIKKEKNPQIKIELMDEYLNIGTNYNFPVNK